MRVRQCIAITLTGAALLAPAGCSGESEEGPTTAPSRTTGSQAATAPRVAAKLGTVTGQANQQAVRTAVDKIGPMVQRWYDSAYLGSYPRTDFSGAYPGFTAGAARRAAADAGLTSNAERGAELSGVSPQQASVSVDLLGAQGRPVGATARFSFTFTNTASTGASDESTIAGQLFLSPKGTGAQQTWQIFGYDMTRAEK